VHCPGLHLQAGFAGYSGTGYGRLGGRRVNDEHRYFQEKYKRGGRGMRTNKREERRKCMIAYHEAGHAVVAAVLGLSLTTVTVVFGLGLCDDYWSEGACRLSRPADIMAKWDTDARC
jgi:hypothetical protein